MAEETLRETLEKNLDNADEAPPAASAPPGGEDSNEPPAQGEPPSSETPPVGDKPASESPAPGVGEPPKDAQGATPAGAPGTGEKPAPQGAPSAASNLKAPQSWRPEIREHWGKLPPEVQQEVVRREQQVMRALNDASRYVTHYNQFQELCAPYSSMIAMDGGNPLNTFKEYLQTSAILRLGAPTEKASAVANAIMQFGIDIQTLDAALAERVNGQGAAPRPNGQGAPQPQFRDPRVDRLLGDMESRRRELDEDLTRRQQSEIDAFAADPKNEFFGDVRNMVADILEIYANQGVRCSLQEAYNKALMLHPEISKVVMARNTAAAANRLVKNNSATVDAKRRAAMLPPGSPNMAPADNANVTLRDSISAAVAQAESRA